MKIVGLVLLVMSSAAFSATNGYEFKMELLKGGKVIAEPRMIQREGDKAKVVQKSGKEEITIEIVANEAKTKSADGIMMKFSVAVLMNGKKTESRFHLFTKNQEKGTIDISDGATSKEEKLSLTVVPTRKTL